MLMIAAIWIAFLGSSSVLCGALGAHVLKSIVSVKQLEIYHTAVTYHQLYVLLLLVVFLFLTFFSQAKHLWPCFWLFSVALVLFSGSLYMYVCFGSPLLMKLTPIGSLLLSFSWLYLVFVVVKNTK